jgi:hypothetical protein
MITKERLEELIKEEKTIYFIDFWGNICPVMLDKDFLIKNLVEFGLGENELTRIDDECSYDARDLFETVKDAKFQLNYKHIKAPDRFLDLPDWNEFTTDIFDTNFYTNKGIGYRMSNENMGFNRRIRIYRIGDLNSDIFKKPLSYENYLEACEIAKKIWLGEKV